MKKKMCCVGVLLVFLTTSGVFAIDPMGPPTAGLKKGQSRVGIDYAYSEADLEESALGISATLKDVKSNRPTANLGYGLTDDWEIFLRLGVTDVEAEDVYDSGYDFAYGFGTKVTFSKDTNTSWGALFQMGWSKTDDDVTFNLSDFGLGSMSTKVEADWY